MFEITGIVKEVYPAQTFGKGFTKREFVLSVRKGENIQDVKFECHGDKVDLLNDLIQGDLIEVEFYVTGREWNGKYYNNLVCFGINYDDGQSTPRRGMSNMPQEEQEVAEEEVPL